MSALAVLIGTFAGIIDTKEKGICNLRSAVSQVLVKEFGLQSQSAWSKMALRLGIGLQCRAAEKQLLKVVRNAVVLESVKTEKEVAAAFQGFGEPFGDLNVVVNNAGVAPTTPPITITERTIYACICY